ncbi:MAG: type II toxin-antitoxin system PemK/MazF family toxin [Candidatus Bipolaricaulia bacterium]
MAYRKGDVVLVPFPFADARATKARPALVLSDEAYERDTGNVILAQITSQEAKFPSDYALRDWTKAGLKRPSIVRLKLATLASSLVRYKSGSLSAADLAEVDAHLKQVLRL